MADIPNYHFREDGLKNWAAIKDYAEDIVNIFYISNEDVVSDWELQGWIDEIHRYHEHHHQFKNYLLLTIAMTPNQHYNCFYI